MKFHSLSLTAVLLILGQPLFALVNLGEGRIDLSIQADLTHDTAIRARNSGQEDTIFNLGTRLIYTRPSRAFDISASLGIVVQRYEDFREFDDENLTFDLSISPSKRIETSRFQFTGNLILDSTTSANEELGEIVTTRTYGVTAGLLYDPSSRFNLRFNAAATREDSESDALIDEDRLSFGTTLEIPASESAFFEIGASVSSTDSDRDNAATAGETYAGYVGMSGLLMPKVSGFLRGGIQVRNTERLGDETGPYLSTGLTWAVDESTQAGLSATRDFGTTLDDRATQTTSISASLSRQLNRRLSAGLGLSYSESDIDGLISSRTDEAYNASADIRYDLTRNTNLTVSADYSDRESNDGAFAYDRWRISAGVGGTW